MNWIIIPARKGSKGFPRKNRKLFEYTARTIPSCMKRKVIVSTDDNDIMSKGEYFGFDVHNRPDQLVQDDTSTREVLLDVIKNYKISEEDILIMLYLTYPERTWDEVEKAYSFFQTFEADSLLCRLENNNDTHPYLWLLDNEDGTGKQLVTHSLYRRQDYPKMFVLSHYIFIGKVKEIENLNNNLYNSKTVFFPVRKPIDVDSSKDFERFSQKQKGVTL